MKANHPVLFLCAALLAIGMKFITKSNGKHLWNPANFGIVAAATLSGEAWISPGQWGSSVLIMFIVGTSGLAVLSNIKRLETGVAFLLTFGMLEYARTVLYLGWEHDVFLLKLSSGSLWLFSFFLIL
jgi:Na+-transporting NADH:ubiquinone oxidoreductase subunit NqrB